MKRLFSVVDQNSWKLPQDFENKKAAKAERECPVKAHDVLPMHKWGCKWWNGERCNCEAAS